MTSVESMIRTYVKAKQEENKATKVVKQYRQHILDYLEQNQMDSVEHEGVKVYTQSRNKEVIDEEALINWLKENDHWDKVMDRVETLNYDKLEELLYNDIIDPTDIMMFTSTNVITALKYAVEEE